MVFYVCCEMVIVACTSHGNRIFELACVSSTCTNYVSGSIPIGSVSTERFFSFKRSVMNSAECYFCAVMFASSSGSGFWVRVSSRLALSFLGLVSGSGWEHNIHFRFLFFVPGFGSSRNAEKNTQNRPNYDALTHIASLAEMVVFAFA